MALATAPEHAGPLNTAAQATYASLFFHCVHLANCGNPSPNVNRPEESVAQLRQELEQTRMKLEQTRTELNQTRTELSRTKASLDETSQLYDSVNDAYWVFIDYVMSSFPSLSRLVITSVADLSYCHSYVHTGGVAHSPERHRLFLP